jgi:16S rRNA (cytosine967-C5)-methyltransferase
VAQLSARQVALIALRAWRKERQFADSIISELLAAAKLSAPDRAFALELFYGVLRNMTLLDFWLSSLRSGRIERELRDILFLGLYQLLLIRTPAHAAVHETVALAPKKTRPLVNGILRAASRRVSELEELAKTQPLNIQFSHPRFLLERWEKSFGRERLIDLCRWNNRPPPIYARINRIKTSLEQFLRAAPGSSILPEHKNFAEIANLPQTVLERGDCYIQDPSTAIACQLLDPKPGETILDACAAPGGKTGYLGELMENCGVIAACDRDPSRVQILRENMARLGVKIGPIFCHDWLRAQTPPEIASLAPFDRILLDVPCSNTGVMRRRVDVRWRLRPAEFLLMQTRQFRLVQALTPLLRSGGILVYSTCSLESEENEEVVQQVLGELSVLQLQEQKRCLPFRDHFDGAFVAKFVKTV